MKQIWVGVEVYQLIVTDVHIFTDFDKAKTWFKEYTGVEYEVDEKGELPDFFYERIPEDYDQTKIFKVEMPG